jgi:Tol biopolymer transport system component
MKRPESRVTSLTGLVVAGAIILFGCTSPLNIEGVRRITPPEEAWSHVTGISWSPDGTELAVTWVMGGPDLRPEGYVYVIDVEGLHPRILTHTRVEGEVAHPAWSPTSSQIAFFSSGRDPVGIWVVDAGDQGAPRFLGEGQDCAWAPNGEEIAIANSTGLEYYAIYILSTRTGVQREVFQLPGEGKYVSGWGIAWSPKGDQLAFSVDLDDHDGSTPPEKDVYVLDLVSGESRRLTESGYNWFPSWSPDGTMIAFSGGELLTQTLIVMRVDDGSIIRPLDVVGVGPVAWSPDGSLIAFARRGVLYVVEAAVALGVGLPDTGVP